MLKQAYTEYYSRANIRKVYPNEFLVRIFKGSYPKLKLDKNYLGKSICDVGCGDGRNIILFDELGFQCSGVEITKEIANKVQADLVSINIKADIREGENKKIPFEDNSFDYLVSWNAAYYMGAGNDFNDYVKEFARVLKKDGILVLSIPMLTHCIYDGSESFKEGYRIIKDDPYKIRNGEIFKSFEDQEDLEKAFSSHFTDFKHAIINDDCFGLNNHWFITVCKLNATAG